MYAQFGACLAGLTLLVLQARGWLPDQGATTLRYFFFWGTVVPLLKAHNDSEGGSP
jgi:hypothetical protein